VWLRLCGCVCAGHQSSVSHPEQLTSSAEGTGPYLEVQGLCLLQLPAQAQAFGEVVKSCCDVRSVLAKACRCLQQCSAKPFFRFVILALRVNREN